MAHDLQQIDTFITSIKRKAQRGIFTNLLNYTLDTLQDSHEYLFSYEVNPQGISWTPLAQSTKDRKGHGRILWETGTLMDSLTSKTEFSIQEWKYSPGSLEVQFGTKVPYAQYHQYSSGIPVRQHVGIPEPLTDTIARKAMGLIMENLK